MEGVVDVLVVVCLLFASIDEQRRAAVDRPSVLLRLEAFGFHVISIDGSNMEQIAAAFAEAKTVKGKPTAIIAKTVKGKGVSFMENQVKWHGSAPNDEQYEQALAELKGGN